MPGNQLLRFTNKGIYCPQAKVYIDPWRPVRSAIITHAHSDHSRPGMKRYLAHRDSVPVMKLRLGEGISVRSVEYGEAILVNGVKISLHPAGHIIGSAQVRLEYKGEVWVISGDYKTDNDDISGTFEPIRCHTFITECTFGLPVYRWPDQQQVFEEMNQWWASNIEKGMVSVLQAYSLGKAQRVIQGLNQDIGPIFTHGSVENTNEVFRAHGIDIASTIRVAADMPKSAFKGGMVIAPGSAVGTSWSQKFAPFSTSIASGWMMIRGARRRRAADRGFVLSDHADWEGLNQAIRETGAEQVYATHGYSETFARWLRETGLDAKVLKTEFEGEGGEEG